MTKEDAIKHLENMKWLLGVNNTTVDDIPLTKVIDDIAALLKAQEPRIMAEAEIRESDFCYLEVYGCSYITPVLLRNESEKRIGVTCDSGSFYWFDMDCDLGKHVRCWTSRPDQATREATPWMT